MTLYIVKLDDPNDGREQSYWVNVGAFTSREKAEAFIENRLKNAWDRHSHFEIDEMEADKTN